MNFLLRAKHWMLFSLVMVPALTPNFVADFFHPKYAFFGAFILWVTVIFGWIYSIGTAANLKLPKSQRKSTNLRDFSLLFAVVYCFYTSQIFLDLDSGLASSKTPSWLVPAHLFSMFGIFYSIWFAAKQLTTLIESREVKFSEFSGRFFLIWFFPVGIWFIQPEVNYKLSSGRLDDQSNTGSVDSKLNQGHEGEEAPHSQTFGRSVIGRFDGPSFGKEDSNVVSIWASKVPLSQIPPDYFDENYGEEDEIPFNQFSSDFGFGYYDHDFVENARDYGETNKEKLSFASYGKSFCEEASKACNIPNVEEFFLMYDFIYKPEVTNVRESKYFKFIGSFRFDKNS